MISIKTEAVKHIMMLNYLRSGIGWRNNVFALAVFVLPERFTNALRNYFGQIVKILTEHAYACG
jgi:hypothetical protein